MGSIKKSTGLSSHVEIKFSLCWNSCRKS